MVNICRSKYSTLPKAGEESRIATALMHGVRSDTDDFVNATPIDYKASEFFSRFVDKDLFISNIEAIDSS